jgi:hypothetical protein
MFMRTLLFLALAVYLVSTQAGIYRWVDDEGVTIYSQTKPATGDAVEIKSSSPPPASKPAAQKQLDTLQQQTNDAQQKRESRKEEQRAAAEDAQIRRENCEAAKHNLDLYTNLGRRVVKGPDGKYSRPSEEVRQQRIEEAKKSIEEFCSE